MELVWLIADYVHDHPDLLPDKISYWDFNAPGITDALRDASVAAIMASALIELSGYSHGTYSEKYISDAEIILLILMFEKYTAAPGTNGGFILLQGVGHKPNFTEVDVPLTYADYYFV